MDPSSVHGVVVGETDRSGAAVNPLVLIEQAWPAPERPSLAARVAAPSIRGSLGAPGKATR